MTATLLRPPIDQQVTFIYAADPAAAFDFYGRLLRLPLVLDQGVCRIYRVAGDAFLGVCGEGIPKDARRDAIVTLVTDAVDDWFRFLTDQGVVAEGPPRHNPTYNIHHFFVRDPAGYLVEFQRFLDPAWPRRET